MFAIDSIPAIFAITRDTYIVFAANAFSLLGMVSLYFLLDGLLDRFIYLSKGLAVILGYVALKLLLEDVVHPPEWVNLVVVIVTLGVAAWLSKRREAADAAGVERSSLTTDWMRASDSSARPSVTAPTMPRLRAISSIIVSSMVCAASRYQAVTDSS